MIRVHPSLRIETLFSGAAVLLQTAGWPVDAPTLQTLVGALLCELARTLPGARRMRTSAG